MTQQQVGVHVGYSAALVGMVETGRRVPSFQFARTVDRLLDARGVLEGLWVPLHEQSSPDARLTDLLEMETRAAEIDSYEGHVIPGLLQTEAYTRALVEAARPPVPADDVESRVVARLDRRSVLTKADPPRFWAIVGEAALHQQHGDRAVMREQLQYLVTEAGTHRVTLQVLPFTAPDPAWGTNFSIFRFANGDPVVYLDTFPLGLHHNVRADVVVRCEEMFDHLREAALPECRSLDLISARAEAFR